MQWLPPTPQTQHSDTTVSKTITLRLFQLSDLVGHLLCLLFLVLACTINVILPTLSVVGMVVGIISFLVLAICSWFTTRRKFAATLFLIVALVGWSVRLQSPFAMVIALSLALILGLPLLLSYLEFRSARKAG
ncbi:hypothetical protein GCM10027296_27340 [Chitinimonas naiadis]